MMFVSSEAISFYEKNVKYFYNEVFRTIANCIIDQAKNGGNVDVSSLLSEIEANDFKNKEEIISTISAISFRKDKTKFSKQTLVDCNSIIEKERTRLYQRNEMKQALEGKTPEEQAEIIKKYLPRKDN